MPCVPRLPENFTSTHTRTLPDFCCQAQFAHSGGPPFGQCSHTIYSNAQCMFGVQHQWGNTLMAALMHRYPRYSRHGSVRLEIAHSYSHAERFALNVWSTIAAKLGLAGRRRVGAFLLVMLCSYSRPSELLPLRTRQLVPPTSSVTNSWSLLISKRKDGQCTKTNRTDVSIFLEWMWCH